MRDDNHIQTPADEMSDRGFSVREAADGAASNDAFHARMYKDGASDLTSLPLRIAGLVQAGMDHLCDAPHRYPCAAEAVVSLIWGSLPTAGERVADVAGHAAHCCLWGWSEGFGLSPVERCEIALSDLDADIEDFADACRQLLRITEPECGGVRQEQAVTLIREGLLMQTSRFFAAGPGYLSLPAFSRTLDLQF